MQKYKSRGSFFPGGSRMRSAQAKQLWFPSVGSRPLGEGCCHAVGTLCEPVKRCTASTHHPRARPGSEPPWKWTCQPGSSLHTPAAVSSIFRATHDGGFPGGAVLKNPPVHAEDTRDLTSIPGLGRSPEVGNGNLPQSSCRDNPMDRGATKSRNTAQLHP